MALGTVFADASAVVGLPEAVVRFLVCMLATFPIHSAWPALPPGWPRHVYSTATGVVLTVISFGPETLKMLLTMAVVYAAMIAMRSRCAAVAWGVSFTHLVYKKYGLYVDAEHVAQRPTLDYTTAAMVLTLKLISMAHCYGDGGRDDAELTPTQRERRLDRLPSVLELLGYTFSCGNLLVGPYNEMADYLAFTNNTGEYAKDMPRPTLSQRVSVSLRLACEACIWAAFHVSVGARLPPKFLATGAFAALPWLPDAARLLAGELSPRALGKALTTSLTMMGVRGKYYFAWMMAESSWALSGLAARRVDAEAKGAEEWAWDAMQNIHPLSCEFAASPVKISHDWNVKTGQWMRIYVYERITLFGKRPGAANQIVALAVSALWHGVYPGYFLTFATFIPWVLAGKALFRLSRAAGPRLGPVLSGANYVLARWGLDAITPPFVLLHLAPSMQVWSSLMWSPHLMVVFWLATCAALTPRKRGRGRGDPRPKAE
ncbi:unnamed protein product [Pedinophyceae sp. YPF-701]|nr:unnamed protein product [Pedinophyceae sp. YPF-701]